jgi:hypothetical protein
MNGHAPPTLDEAGSILLCADLSHRRDGSIIKLEEGAGEELR